jgi:malate dehydrogenase (oxaloacetate-decarboxylating)(NADP+)
MVTGVTRSFNSTLDEVRRVIDPARGAQVIGMSIVLSRGRIIFIADTNITELPDAPELAQIAIQAARAVRRFGHEPKLAFISYSTFGNPPGERMEKVRDAVALLDRREDIDFEYEGEMSPDIALNPDSRRLYPFSRLTEPANLLIMPAIHSASISTKLLATLGGATVIGPLLIGLEASVQIAPLNATVADIVTLAAMAAYDLSPGPK